MASVNKVILIGNLGADPEVRYLESGSAVAKFSIATTEAYNNKNGERIENTEWHRIELWEGLAKVAEKYLTKGSPVYIEGKLKTDKWTDQNGVERTAVSIRGTSMTLLGSANQQTSGSAAPGYQAPPAPSRQSAQTPPSANQSRVRPPQPGEPGFIDDSDDLPF